jgi:phosphoribosylglycinamide formyltransferase 1
MRAARDFTVVVLISGRGSNCQSLIRQEKNYSIVGVVSNNADAPGLNCAREAGIKAIAIDRKNTRSLMEQKDLIYSRIEALSPSLIALAGYMQILESDFVERFEGKIVNIHPSLLPRFKGLDTHKRALQAFHQGGGTVDAEHGCTVHYVDREVDTGPIIAQARCRIKASDSKEMLAARVLELEHRLFPWVVNAIAANDIAYRDGLARFSRKAIQDAVDNDFFLPGPVSALQTG